MVKPLCSGLRVIKQLLRAFQHLANKSYFFPTISTVSKTVALILKVFIALLVLNMVSLKIVKRKPDFWVFD